MSDSRHPWPGRPRRHKSSRVVEFGHRTETGVASSLAPRPGRVIRVVGQVWIEGIGGYIPRRG